MLRAQASRSRLRALRRLRAHVARVLRRKQVRLLLAFSLASRRRRRPSAATALALRREGRVEHHVRLSLGRVALDVRVERVL